MPYIITTHRHLDDPTAEFLPDALPGVSRRAVASPEERTRCLWAMVTNRHGGPEHLAAVVSPGEIGPLPDGTVIQVERRTYDWMAADLESREVNVFGMSDADLLAAWNVEFGSMR